MGKKEVGKKERGEKEKKIAQRTNIFKLLTVQEKDYVRDVCFLFSQHTRSYHQGDVYLSLMNTSV